MSQFFALHQNSMHFIKTFLNDVYLNCQAVVPRGVWNVFWWINPYIKISNFLELIKFIHSLRLVLLFQYLICARSNTILQLQKLNDTTCHSETYIKRTRASLSSKNFYRFFCKTNRYISCSTPELIGHQRPSRGAKYLFHCINQKKCFVINALFKKQQHQQKQDGKGVLYQF